MNPDKTSEHNYVDVMNLYIKNLDPKVTNNDLFNAFRAFGRIVSARVMSNPATNQSKGYGFVSYGRSDEARMALEQMNGKMFFSKPLVVSYHAPKKPRQVPQVSPTNDYSSSYQDTRQQQQQYNHHHHIHHDLASSNTTMSTSNVNGLGIDNVDQIAIDIKDLSIGQNNTIPAYPIQRKVKLYNDEIINLGLSSSSSPPPPSSLSGGRLAKDYKHTTDGRPTLRRKSSLESISTVMTESSANLQRQRMTQAVLQCDVPFDNQNLVSDIVDMLLTLKKKERSLCIFNQDFLKTKIQLALEALETFHDGDDSDQEDEEEKALQKFNGDSLVKQQHDDIPKTIPVRVSKAIPIVAPPSSPPPSSNSPVNSRKTATGLSSENKAIIESLLKDMQGKAVHEKKQLLGDRLFPLVKATGTKQAPKVTIQLLDSVDLQELANMMFDKEALKKQVDNAFEQLKRQ
ncbi:uncharacterized protein BX664DRAFT_256366 [Halteromyces radiatus]|uniref:uncharacterized protein n=1 Tax=Halteromyces radiatus TaxID=101107 RepID=UPI00221FE23E|nr:uncharacterized protein BX664DRAFT_256366 [Halteromyces radiatus]KAI8098992.1 hypothetical protein BX664DRAFT_256366 [Halteromyces radiatus]